MFRILVRRWLRVHSPDRFQRGTESLRTTVPIGDAPTLEQSEVLAVYLCVSTVVSPNREELVEHLVPGLGSRCLQLWVASQAAILVAHWLDEPQDESGLVPVVLHHGPDHTC
jgi:hypothetical protein